MNSNLNYKYCSSIGLSQIKLEKIYKNSPGSYPKTSLESSSKPSIDVIFKQENNYRSNYKFKLAKNLQNKRRVTRSLH